MDEDCLIPVNKQLSCFVLGSSDLLTGIQGRSVQGFNDHGWPIWFWWCICSLLMSKWMALRSVGGQVIEKSNL